jgi:DNA-binding response OmpR family regulator/tetratricopeptide (TPR) repeat protein
MAPYVLVVESDPTLQKRIGAALGEAQYEIAAEADLSWARRNLQQRTPDAVILDTHLPDGSGFGFADELRANAASARVPIFFVASTHRGASHQTEAKRRFAPAEYLPTPLDVGRLLALMLQTVPPAAPSATPAVPGYPGVIADPAQQREKREVEITAKHMVTGAQEPQLRGSLSRRPFARVLQRIYTNRMTGSLLLVRGKTKKLIFFSEGYPFAVKSNVLRECLGQILVGQRMISPEVLAESLRRMKETRKQQGEVLVGMGALSPYNLSRALTLQTEAKLLEVFSWREGDFVFRKGQPSHDSAMPLDRSPAALILEGIRRHYDAERLHAVLERLSGQYLLPSSDPRKRLQDITTDPNERRFVDTLDGTVKLETALASSPIPSDRARLLIVAMAEAGMLTPARAPARVRLDEPRTPPPADLAAAQAHQNGDRSREEMVAILEVMRVQTHFEVLGVQRDASPVQLMETHRALAREFHPDRFRLRAEDVRRVANGIFERLEDAYRVLSDATARRKYVAQLDRKATTGLPAPPAPPGIESAATTAERVYFTGVAHLRARRYREAAEAFRQATALAPHQASYRSALGWALYRQAPADSRSVASALAELRKAVESDQSNPWVRISLGRFFAETGLVDDAIKSFEAALRLSPGLPDIEEEIRRLRGET